MNINFHGKSVLVTGGTKGIGESIVKAFFDSGASSINITGKSESPPNWIRSVDFDGKIKYYQIDFSVNNWEIKFKEMIDYCGGFDCFVNNAGINFVHDITGFPQQEMKEIIRVNLEAPLVATGMVAKKMKEKGFGRIVNIASIFGVVSKEKRSVYTATKSGLIGATKTMALDFLDTNVLVNAVSPGFIETTLTRRVLGDDGVSDMCRKIPLRRLGQPEEVAKAVIFLCSSENTYITGHNLVIDGGFVCA